MERKGAKIIPLKGHTKKVYTSKQNFGNVPQHETGSNQSDADVEWHGNSKDVLSGFPPEVKQNLGYGLRRVQQGLTPSDLKIMREVGNVPLNYAIKMWLDGTA